LYTRAELLDAIRRWVELYGSAPARTDWAPERARQRCDPDVAAAKVARYESGEWPSAATVRNHFGSFRAAVEAAGVQAPPARGKVLWSDEAIIEALRDLAYECGRPPRPGDLEHGTGDLPSVDVVTLRFGSWAEAITAAGLGASSAVPLPRGRRRVLGPCTKDILAF
jgi:hypothetical protein